jgi:WD40 repeat protein
MFKRFSIALTTACLFVCDTDIFGQVLKERATLSAHPQRVSCVAFSSDSTKLATACRVDSRSPNERFAELRLWDVATGKECGFQKCSQPDINHLAFSPDGKVLASDSGVITLWDLTVDKERVTLKERTTLKLDLGSLLGLAFSADGERLGAVGYGTAKVWDVVKNQEISSFKLRVNESPTFSPDLETLATPNHQDVDLWDTKTGRIRTSLLEHRGAVSHMAFVANGKTLVVSSFRCDADLNCFGEVKMWDAIKGEEIGKLDLGQILLFNLVISPDAKTSVLLESEGREGKCKLSVMDLPRGKTLGTVSFNKRSEVPFYLTISPDGKTLAGGANDGTLRLWDIALP